MSLFNKKTSLITPVQAAINLMQNNNIFSYAEKYYAAREGNKYNRLFKRAKDMLKENNYLNLMFLNSISQVAPIATGSKKMKQNLLKAFSNNVLLAKRNRQEIEPEGAVLLIIALKDRLLRVHTGGKRLITDSQGDSVINKMGPYLKKEKYMEAATVGLQEIERLMEYNKNYEIFTSWLGRWRGVFISPLLIFFSYSILKHNVIANYKYETTRGLENEQSNEASSQLYDGNEGEDDNREDDDICGICLESTNGPSMFDVDMENLTGYERRWYLSDLISLKRWYPTILNICTAGVLVYYNFWKAGKRNKIVSVLAFAYCFRSYRVEREKKENEEQVNRVNRVRTLACGHSFHTSCIDRWIQNRSTCPLCRANILTGNVPELDGLPMPTAPGVEAVGGNEAENEGNDRHGAYRFGDRVYVRTSRHSILGITEHLPATILRVSMDGETADIQYHNQWRVNSVYPRGIRYGVRIAILTSWAWGSVLYGRNRHHRYARMRRRYRNNYAYNDVNDFWNEISYGNGRGSTYDSYNRDRARNTTINNIYVANAVNNINSNSNASTSTTSSSTAAVTTTVPAILRGRDPSSTWYLDVQKSEVKRSVVGDSSKQTSSKSDSWWDSIKKSSKNSSGSSSRSSSGSSWSGKGGGSSGSW